MKHKKLLIGGVAVAAATVIFIGLWQAGFVGNSDRRLYRQIEGRADLVALYDQAKQVEANIKKEPEKVEWYLELGQLYKSLADRSGNTRGFYEKSLSIYERGIEKFGNQNILFYLNGGKLAEFTADYSKAEQYYREAIRVSPGDANGYLYLVDLYIYHLKKSKEDIIKVIDQGGQALVNPLPMIAARASYLRRIGDYRNAIKDYEVLSQNFPNNSSYKEIIAELKAAIEKSAQ